jgi:uncharacterized protein YndB with AHSA1/START domain
MIFAEHGKQTKITIHTLLESAADRAAAINGGFSIGWNDSLDRLAERLAKMQTTAP